MGKVFDRSTILFNSRHQLIQFKVIHCFHCTKTKLHTILSSVSTFCDKCKVTEDTTAHTFWFCRSLSDFGLAYLIGTLMLITCLFCWTRNLLSSAFHNTLLAFQNFTTGPHSGYDRGQEAYIKELEVIFISLFSTLDYGHDFCHTNRETLISEV